MDGQGNLERTLKVRKKSGNLKIDGYGRQSSENLFILFKREKDVLSHEIAWANLPPHRGLLLKMVALIYFIVSEINILIELC